MRKLPSKAELVGGRSYNEAAKSEAKSLACRTIREMVRILPAPFDVVPSLGRVGRSWCYVVDASPVGAVAEGRRSDEGKERGENGYRGERKWERECDKK